MVRTMLKMTKITQGMDLVEIDGESSEESYNGSMSDDEGEDDEFWAMEEMYGSMN
jgi:hypothetical protein